MTKKTTAKKATGKKSAASPAKKKSSTATKNASAGQDIIQLILEDHKPPKKLIKIMKDGDKPFAARKKAFEEFAPLLIQHAKPEEQVLYVYMKDEEEMREDGFEGDVEHQLADQMIEEAKRAKDEDLMSARIKVLAELVEHHIEEEEEEMLPDFKKNTEREERMELGRVYLEAQENVLEDGAERRPELEPMDEASIQH